MRTGADAIPAIGSRRELFVDDFLIGGLNGARLKLHEPKPGGVAIRYDTPWEGYPDTPLSFFTTVLKDGDTYRMYYRGAYDPLMVNNCYAESVDGVSWSKPNKSAPAGDTFLLAIRRYHRIIERKIVDQTSHDGYARPGLYRMPAEQGAFLGGNELKGQ